MLPLRSITSAGYSASSPSRWTGRLQGATRLAESFGEVGKVGVEGTGSYGAGLARFLARHGIAVIEVDRPNRAERGEVASPIPSTPQKPPGLRLTDGRRACRSRETAASRRSGCSLSPSALPAKPEVKALIQMRHLAFQHQRNCGADSRDSATDRVVKESSFRLLVRAIRYVATKASLSSLAHRIGPWRMSSPT